MASKQMVQPHAWIPGHDVQFYKTEESLYASVANFLSDGARAAQPLVVIATEAHRRSFGERLASKGVDVGTLIQGRDAVWLDARETLSTFMEGGHPNPERFEATVGSVFERLMADRRYLVVRAYGEMVDLLWKDGNVDAAIELEDLWNGLAAKYSFSLLCAYAIAEFTQEANARSFHQICGQHARVFFLES